MELVAALLSRARVRIVKCISKHAAPTFMSTSDAISMAPGDGIFKCCTRGHVVNGRSFPCDKGRLRIVIERMLQSSIEHLFRVGEWEKQRYFHCTQQSFLRGLPLSDPAAGAESGPEEQSSTMTLAGFRRSLNWRPEDDEAALTGRGWSLLHWAAFAGDARAVRALLTEAGTGGIEAPTPQGVEGAMRAGMRPLQLALMAEDTSFEAATVLLEARADPTATTANEYRLDVLLNVALFRGVAPVRWWLDRFPEWDLERRDAFIGSTAASYAAGNSGGGAALAELLRRRADPCTSSGFMSRVDAPLFSAVLTGNSEAVQLLLEARCSPHVGAQHCWRRWRATSSGARLAVQLRTSCGWRCNSLMVFLASCEGATPLHFAAKAGDVASVRLLLRARAEPARRSSTGQTPLDWAAAEFGCAPEPITELLRGPLSIPAPTRKERHVPRLPGCVAEAAAQAAGPPASLSPELLRRGPRGLEAETGSGGGPLGPPPSLSAVLKGTGA